MTNADLTPVMYYSALRDQKDDLELKIKEVDQRLQGAEAELISWFLENNLTSVKLPDGTCFSRSEKLWATVKLMMSPDGCPIEIDGKFVRDTQGAAQALREADLAHFITENFNSNTVSAYVREQIRAGEDLHPAITRTFDIVSKPSVQRRKRG